ncbi:MAG: UDP-2,3-diacylglucosamine diphosphatase LpxI [Puniceicoccales bacterium]|jgi:DUF1009 family protein|nr:UDP-2,3-diacylglucosamine diphosphatase LpxI [Puniceicoccales bacterium]
MESTETGGDGKVLSRFLPKDFSPSDGVTLLAGRGVYPYLCARRMVRAGVRCNLIASEEADDAVFDLFPPEGRARYNSGQIGKLLRRLEEYGSRYAIMAGQIAPKRLFHGLKFDLTALRLLAALRRRNAETIFGTLADEIERRGVRLLDARAFMDDDLASAGFMTAARPNPRGIGEGISVARSIAALDIGQGIVARKGTTLAVEGFDGTDGMLRRCSEFQTDRKWFIKTSKPQQDFRFDVPIIGKRTLDALDAGGIRAVAVEAGTTILLGRECLIADADRRHIGIYGYEIPR